MKVQLKEQSYHRLRNRPRNNISDCIVDSEYNIKQLPNYEPASKLFLRTCLNQRDLNSKNLQTSGHSEWMLSSSSYSTQFSEDGTYFVYGDCSPIIQFWEVGKVLVNKIAQHPTAFKFDDHVCCMALSPDATRILAGCRRKVTIYDTQT
jgi:WD40 repeat protein